MLAVVVLLASAGASPASEKKSARSSRASSASARNPASVPKPSTESLSVRRDSSGAAGAKVLPGFDLAPISAPTAEEQLLVDLINVERTTRKLKPVKWDGVLAHLARLHGDDMRTVRRTSHNSTRDGADYSARLARTSYRASAAAENVAYNSDVVKAHRALMASPGHRRNILDPELATVGTAVLTEKSGQDWVYVVEDFATPIAHISDADAARKLRDSLAKAKGRWRSSMPEDTALSRRLGGMLESMIESGAVRAAVGLDAGEGWTLAYTSMDPAVPPASALARAAKADGYALAVTFRKTRRYPFGTYWAILYLKGQY